MFTLEINFEKIILGSRDKRKYSKYYCKSYKGMNVLSNNIDCALKFKTIGSAKTAMTKFYKKHNGTSNILGYDIKRGE